MDPNEIDLLIDLHADGPRQGPGCPESTRRALSFLPAARFPDWHAADIGCGTGASTLVLAEALRRPLTAVDLFRPFLDRLAVRAAESGLSDYIQTIEASMDDLPFDDDVFDLIWSEGAVYVMGFAEGLRAWRRHLRSGGYLVVSELSWLRSGRPADLEAYWKGEYPQIDTISAKIRVLEDAGYAPEGHFVLPEECWSDGYYGPMESRFPDFLERQGYSEQARRLVDAERREMAMFARYKDYYGYVFYIGRKISPEP